MSNRLKLRAREVLRVDAVLAEAVRRPADAEVVVGRQRAEVVVQEVDAQACSPGSATRPSCARRRGCATCCSRSCEPDRVRRPAARRVLVVVGVAHEHRVGVVEAVIELGVDQLLVDAVRIVAVLLRRERVVRRQRDDRRLVDVAGTRRRRRNASCSAPIGPPNGAAGARLVERRLGRRRRRSARSAPCRGRSSSRCR